MTHRSLRFVGSLLAMVLLAALWPAPAGAASYPNDPDYVRQWNLRRIGAPAAWKITKGKGVNVAVIDTGVNTRHEDLRGNILLKKQYDAINDDGDAADLHGHGTGVAGVIAAVTNNKKGIAGVAPEAKIMPVRAFSALAGANSNDVADSIMWSADNGANVANLSLGNPLSAYVGQPLAFVGAAPTLAAILYATAKGVLVVAAAGNESEDICGLPAFNPAAICVGATDSLDRMASFSNYGVRLDVVAPGKGVYTTGGTTPIGYGPINGTSFSSPTVAGVGALLMSMGANNLLAGLIIRATAKDLGLPGYDLTYGFGRLDAKAAVDLCSQIC